MLPLPVAEITVTPTGQVSNSLGGETVFSLNRADAEKLVDRLEISRRNLQVHLENVKAEARRLSGFRAPASFPGPVFRGRLARPGYFVERYALPDEGDVPLPVLFMVPDTGTNHRALIYLHPQGKSASAAPGGEMEQLVKRGYALIAPDLSGIGELGRANDATAFLAVLLGRSIAGLRAVEIIRCLHFLKSRSDVNSNDIGAVAWQSLSVPLLHAAAFDDSIGKIA